MTGQATIARTQDVDGLAQIVVGTNGAPLAEVRALGLEALSRMTGVADPTFERGYSSAHRGNWAVYALRRAA